MKDLRSKKAIAASLSLTLALGSVPAVALADDADENSGGATSEQSTQAELHGKRTQRFRPRVLRL